MKEKLVICMSSKNLSVAMYRGTRHVRDLADEYSTIIKTWIIIWMGTSRILTLHPRTLNYFHNIKKTFKKWHPKARSKSKNPKNSSAMKNPDLSTNAQIPEKRKSPMKRWR